MNHSAAEYVRGTIWYTNSVESYFAILKRGIMCSFHNVSEAHRYRYLAEFDFRTTNSRTAIWSALRPS